jgi:hypothetical protein
VTKFARQRFHFTLEICMASSTASKRSKILFFVDTT